MSNKSFNSLPHTMCKLLLTWCATSSLTPHCHSILSIQRTCKQAQRPLSACHIFHALWSQCLYRRHFVFEPIPGRICKDHLVTCLKFFQLSEMCSIIMCRDHEIIQISAARIAARCFLQKRIAPLTQYRKLQVNRRYLKNSYTCRAVAFIDLR